MENNMKKCNKCKEERELSEYYKNKHMADGYLGVCKNCRRKEAIKYRQEHLEEQRAYDRKRAKLPHRQKLAIEIGRRNKKAKPYLWKAHDLVAQALKKGTLTKPNICEKCKKPYHKIEGHHEDYSKPLDVLWLCIPCHRQLHLGKKVV